MRKLLCLVLMLAMVITIMPSVTAEDNEPITLTVFRGDPGDQPTEDNKIYKLIEDTFGVKIGRAHV